MTVIADPDLVHIPDEDRKSAIELRTDWSDPAESALYLVPGGAIPHRGDVITVDGHRVTWEGGEGVRTGYWHDPDKALS